MKIAYFDCFSGIAGDMILGALIDLGVETDYFKDEIKKLDISAYSINVKKTNKNNINASDVYISVDLKNQHQRSFKDIKKLINDSYLEKDTKDLSKKIFYNLAVAESKVHNVEIDDVHFHEVGAVDSIIDIVGSVICLKKLGIGQVFCSKLPLGSGYVKCSHGIIPVPAPATVELVKDIPTYKINSNHEMVTPTGAAVITTIAEGFNYIPQMKIIRTGFGAGKIKSNQPGVLKIVLGELEKKE